MRDKVDVGHLSLMELVACMVVDNDMPEQGRAELVPQCGTLR